MSTAARKFVGDTVVYGVGRFLIPMRSLIFVAVFGVTLGPGAYGLFTQALLLVGLLQPFAGLKLATAAVRLLAGETDPERMRRRFGTAWLATAATAVLVMAVFALPSRGIAVAVFGDADAADLVGLTGILLAATMIMSYVREYFRIVGKIRLLTALELIATGVETAIVVALLLFDSGIAAALWALIGTRAAFALGMTIGVSLRHGWFLTRPDLAFLREMLAFSAPLLPNGLFRWAVNYADRIVIVQVMGITAVGVYAGAYSLGEALNLLILPMGYVLYPIIARLWDQGNRDEVRRCLEILRRAYVLVLLPGCVALAILGPVLLEILGGAAFAVDRLLVLLIALGTGLNGLLQVNLYVYHLTRRTWPITVTMVAGAILNLGLNLVLVPRFGLYGAAASTAATFLVMATGATMHGRTRLPYRLFLGDTAKGAAASLTIGAAIWSLPTRSPILLVAAVTAGVVLYVGALFALRVTSREDLGRLTSLLRRKEGT